MMRKLHFGFSAALVLLSMGAHATRGQQDSSSQQGSQQSQQSQSQPSQGQQPVQPIPAYRSPLASAADNTDANAGGQTLAADTRSLVGAQSLTLGAPKTGYSFWTPYFYLSSTLDSNPQSSGSGPGWATWTSFFGGVDLHHTSGNSDLALSYVGGGAISNDSGVNNGDFQQFGLAEKLTLHRSDLTFLDQVSYTPEAAFGYAGIGGPNLENSGNVGLLPGFSPNQSILTALGQRISNSFVTQADVYATRRSYFTFVGSYGLLNYFENDLNNNYEAIGQAGYNYQITRKDSIAVLYRFDAFRYRHIAQSINSHTFDLSYARRVTGRLAFQLSGGPEIAYSETPIPSSGSSTTATATGPASKTQQFFWDLNTLATYTLRRTSFTASYQHGVTGGSGVLAGAVTDNASGSANRALTPTLNGSFTAGYSRNVGLAITNQTTLETASQTYNYWFAGVSFTKVFGRSMNLNAGYQVNYQNSDAQFCVSLPCGTTFIQHQIFLAVGWRPRPITF